MRQTKLQRQQLSAAVQASKHAAWMASRLVAMAAAAARAAAARAAAAKAAWVGDGGGYLTIQHSGDEVTAARKRLLTARLVATAAERATKAVTEVQ